jgi:hypothetical protein
MVRVVSNKKSSFLAMSAERVPESIDAYSCVSEMLDVDDCELNGDLVFGGGCVKIDDCELNRVHSIGGGCAKLDDEAVVCKRRCAYGATRPGISVELDEGELAFFFFDCSS